MRIINENELQSLYNFLGSDLKYLALPKNTKFNKNALKRIEYQDKDKVFRGHQRTSMFEKLVALDSDETPISANQDIEVNFKQLVGVCFYLIAKEKATSIEFTKILRGESLPSEFHLSVSDSINQKITEMLNEIFTEDVFRISKFTVLFEHEILNYFNILKNDPDLLDKTDQKSLKNDYLNIFKSFQSNKIYKKLTNLINYSSEHFEIIAKKLPQYYVIDYDFFVTSLDNFISSLENIYKETQLMQRDLNYDIDYEPIDNEDYEPIINLIMLLFEDDNPKNIIGEDSLALQKIRESFIAPLNFFQSQLSKEITKNKKLKNQVCRQVDLDYYKSNSNDNNQTEILHFFIGLQFNLFYTCSYYHLGHMIFDKKCSQKILEKKLPLKFSPIPEQYWKYNAHFSKNDYDNLKNIINKI